MAVSHPQERVPLNVRSEQISKIHHFLALFVQFLLYSKAMSSNITFSVLMTQLYDESDFKTVKELSDQLGEQGYPIKYTTLMSYKKFEVVPPFEKARQIMDTFGYDISDDRLREILDYSRTELKNINSSRRYLQRGFRLNPRHFKKDMTVEQLEQRISERADVLFGDNATINMYIEYLIKKDMEESE